MLKSDIEKTEQLVSNAVTLSKTDALGKHLQELKDQLQAKLDELNSVGNRRNLAHVTGPGEDENYYLPNDVEDKLKAEADEEYKQIKQTPEFKKKYPHMSGTKKKNNATKLFKEIGEYSEEYAKHLNDKRVKHALKNPEEYKSLFASITKTEEEKRADYLKVQAYNTDVIK